MAISLINAAGASAWPGSSVALPAMTITTGNLLIIFTWNNIVTSISDTVGNIFHQFAFNPLTNLTGWYVKNVKGGTDIVTVNFSSSSYEWVGSMQFSGVDIHNPVDGIAVGSGTGTTGTPATTNTFNTQWPVEVLVAASGWENFGAVTTGWTSASINFGSGAGHGQLSYKIVASKQTGIDASDSQSGNTSDWDIIAQGFIGAGQKPNGAGLLLGVG